MTYALTDRVGRKYSVFGNAIRTYRPGCVIGDRAMEHPMALPETVRRWRNGGPHEFAVFLTREAARTSVIRQGTRESWFPEAVETAAHGMEDLSQGPDPFGNALLRKTTDGDAVHPLGAGDDAVPKEADEPAAAVTAQAKAG